MKAVAAHAGVVIAPWKGESVGGERMGAVEGGVETGDLDRVRKRAARGAHRGEIVRLMQRRERDKPLNLRLHVRRDLGGCGAALSSVHDPVADGVHRLADHLAGDLQRRFQRAFVGAAALQRAGLVLAAGPLQGEPGGLAADPVHMTGHALLARVARKHGEFQ